MLQGVPFRGVQDLRSKRLISLHEKGVRAFLKSRNGENDEDNSDSYKQGVECWIGRNHGNDTKNTEIRGANHGCRVPQTTGLEIPDFGLIRCS